MTELEQVNLETSGNEDHAQPASLGGVLQAARAAKNLTQQDVSNSLRYSVKQIDALENNAFGLLPDAMITRGFIRNYARLLEIDAEPLLASYRASVATDSDKGIAVQSSMSPVMLSKESLPWLKYILASILILFFLLVWLFYVDYMPKYTDAVPEASPAVVEVPAAPVAEPLPEVALPSAQRQADGELAATDVVDSASVGVDVPTVDVGAVSKPVNANVAQTATKPAAQPVTAPQSATVPVPAVTAPPVVTASATTVAVKPAAKALSLAFTAQTWVSVTDKSGKVVYEKMSHSGDMDTVDGTPPLSLIIGNASATKLSFGGKDVDLTAYTKNNVARITLE